MLKRMHDPGNGNVGNACGVNCVATRILTGQQVYSGCCDVGFMLTNCILVYCVTESQLS